ncbi:MAG: GT2 family glycosyltransferase [Myxococcota bacterium]
MTDGLAVIIPTIGRSTFLGPLLADLDQQASADVAIVVVDQSDGLEAARVRTLVAQYARVRLERRAPGLPAARNHGAACTEAPILLYFDDDVRLLPGCLDAHRAVYADPTVGGAVGRIIERFVRPNTVDTCNRVSRSGRVRTNLMGTTPCDVQTLKGANMSIRRRALAEAGAFDEGYLGTAFLEDADLTTRIRRNGWSLRFVPEAEVVHLSAPQGGVRVESDRMTERWRFENTGYFLRRHRGRVGLVAAVPTFAAIAARRAVAWRQPDVVPELMEALIRGWRRAG